MLDIPTLFQEAQPRYPPLNRQAALIAGSSKGIGRAMAVRLGKEGLHGMIPAQISPSQYQI